MNNLKPNESHIKSDLKRLFITLVIVVSAVAALAYAQQQTGFLNRLVVLPDFSVAPVVDVLEQEGRTEEPENLAPPSE